ncbi:MAG TPA: MBL fold metallo-hydrolase [Bryobacteraceae bacterium]
MATVTEIAPDVYRISEYFPGFDMQFNHFLVRDEEPLLYHTGLRRMFPDVRDAVAHIIDPASLRWIGFSHFESDECGALNQWLEVAPRAQPVCGIVGALVSVNDFSNRPAHAMNDGETLTTGRRRFRFCRTAHVPHGWDSSAMFEETDRTLFCSDLFHHNGQPEPLTESDVVDRSRQTLITVQQSLFSDYVPYTAETGSVLNRLADLKPATLAIMHGSSFHGDGERALRDLAVVFRDVLGSGRATGAAG